MQFCRTSMLIGEQALQKIKDSNVAVFGLGGVGSYVVEALARAGVGRLTVVDCDVVDISNINRQLFALHSTVGQPKTTVAANRIADINPACNVTAVNCRFDSTTADKFDFASYDYVVDAIDTVTSKLLLVELCKQHNTPIIASMGTGNKLQSNFEVADIYQTSVCPLCKVMRKELKARNIPSLKVVYSKDMPQQPLFQPEESDGHRQTPSSISFVPSAAGLLIAGEVIRDIIG